MYKITDCVVEDCMMCLIISTTLEMGNSIKLRLLANNRMISKNTK